MAKWPTRVALFVWILVAAQAAKTTTDWVEKAETNIRCLDQPPGMSDDISVLDVRGPDCGHRS